MVYNEIAVCNIKKKNTEHLKRKKKKMAEKEKQEEEASCAERPNIETPAAAATPPKPLRFDPSRMIGIIRRKALIKDLAAVYHAECLACCQELLELQRKWEEPYIDSKASEDMRKETTRQPKRLKKTR